MLTLAAALIGPILIAVVGAAVQEGYGRRRHIALIRAEAEALAALPPDLGAAKYMRASLRNHLRTYHERNHPLRPTIRSLLPRLLLGSALYFVPFPIGIFALFALKDSEHQAWIAFPPIILIQILGTAIMTRPLVEIRRHRKKLKADISRARRLRFSDD